jgi:hypothetical protein
VSDRACALTPAPARTTRDPRCQDPLGDNPAREPFQRAADVERSEQSADGGAARCSRGWPNTRACLPTRGFAERRAPAFARPGDARSTELPGCSPGAKSPLRIASRSESVTDCERVVLWRTRPGATVFAGRRPARGAGHGRQFITRDIVCSPDISPHCNRHCQNVYNTLDFAHQGGLNRICQETDPDVGHRYSRIPSARRRNAGRAATIATPPYNCDRATSRRRRTSSRSSALHRSSEVSKNGVGHGGHAVDMQVVILVPGQQHCGQTRH